MIYLLPKQMKRSETAFTLSDFHRQLGVDNGTISKYTVSLKIYIQLEL